MEETRLSWLLVWFSLISCIGASAAGDSEHSVFQARACLIFLRVKGHRSNWLSRTTTQLCVHRVFTYISPATGRGEYDRRLLQ